MVSVNNVPIFRAIGKTITTYGFEKKRNVFLIQFEKPNTTLLDLLASVKKNDDSVSRQIQIKTIYSDHSFFDRVHCDVCLPFSSHKTNRRYNK